MNRKEMLIAISNQSGCSLRKVRKRVFQRMTENKRLHPQIKFYETMTDASVDWKDYSELKAPEKFHEVNTFDVCDFPSGVVVLFYVNSSCFDCDYYPQSYGVRLFTRKGLYKVKKYRKE